MIVCEFIYNVFIYVFLGTISGERQGPHFVFEPPQKIEFSNSTGARIECAAHASPTPQIEWLKSKLLKKKNNNIYFTY